MPLITQVYLLKFNLKYPTPVNLSYLSNFLCVFKPTSQTNTRIFCRSMFTNIFNNTAKVLYQGIKGSNSRGFSTFNAFTRIAEPQKGIFGPLEIDPELQLEIMLDYDASGVKHIYIVDIDFKHPIYFKVYGAFSTTNSPFEGRWPIKVSDYTLYGKYKIQYLHEYLKPKLIKKSAAIVDMLANYGMSHPEYQKVLKQLKNNYENFH